MPRESVPAIYDGGERIRLLGEAPARGPYRVLITFVEPASEEETPSDRFRESFGAWKDERPIEATLHEVRQGRLSRTKPPAL